MSIRASLFTALLASSAVACDSDSEFEIKPGRLEFYENPARIEAPANGVVGGMIDMLVYTYGGDCVSLDSTEIEISGSNVDIAPWDRHEIRESDICLANLTLIEHEVSFVPQTSGQITVSVNGVRRDEGPDEAISIEFEIEVTP